MNILIIRHGETDLNAARVIQPPTATLSERGLEQAQCLGRYLTSRHIERVIASDYARARSTAEAVSRHTGAPLSFDPELRERNFGDLRGSAYADLGDLDFTAQGYVPPNGESWEMFHRRVDTAWSHVIAATEGLHGDLAVVTHGLVISSLVDRILDVSAYPAEPPIVVANTSFTVVESTHPWRVSALASTEHLPEQNTDGAMV